MSCKKQQIQCVLLNACYSEVQAEVIAEHIDYVIGMTQEIHDTAAISFSKGFYLALGNKCPIEECYEYGCNAIQLQIGRRNVTEQHRKFTAVEYFDRVDIPEYLKPIIKINSKLVSAQTSSNAALPNKKKEIQAEISQVLDQGKILDQDRDLEQENELPCGASHSEGIPDFLNRLLEDYFNKSSLKWSLCFTGEDQSSKLGELIGDLRNGFSGTGNGKQIPSGFSYWGIVPTLAWGSTCSDQLYPVMRDSISSFNKRWNALSDKDITEQKYHYVSLGVGTGDKDNDILKRLYDSNISVRYFPVDMSSTMLRLGVQNATRGIPLKGNHILPVQIDFSFRNNITELRNLLDQVDGNDSILFSLLGNTLANFQDDTELLQNLSKLMRSGDKLLLEVATTEELNEEVVAEAAKEYANASSFKKFVTSTLFQYTDLHIDFESICFEGSIEPGNKAIFIKVLYRNSAREIISVMLPDREPIEFKEGDTIRLLTTRKYTSVGINKVISDSKLRVISSSSSLLGGRNKYGFGLDLILLVKEPI